MGAKLSAARAIEAAYRADWARLLGLLARRFGDLDLAEEALAEAFAAAARDWRRAVPEQPAAWLMTAAARKALDRLRRRATADTVQALPDVPEDGPDMIDPNALPDERLALIFTCCHPALAIEARVALTLRLVAGLTTAEIARLFLIGEATMAARITRAKRKIAAAHIPFREPDADERAARMGGVLAVVYLLFTEGYAASSGERLVREALAAEAIRLGELLVQLAPGDCETTGLLALMLLQNARRDARVGPDGELVLLADQDHTRWRHDEMARARTLLGASSEPEGAYRLQARIAEAHCSAAGSDWPTVAALYARLETLTGSPVVRLNRAVAVAEAEGPEAGLALLAGLDARLPHHYQLPLVRGELLARLGRKEDATAALQAALALTANQVERRHLQSRIAALQA